jgi:hypothetical protein
MCMKAIRHKLNEHPFVTMDLQVNDLVNQFPGKGLRFDAWHLAVQNTLMDQRCEIMSRIRQRNLRVPQCLIKSRASRSRSAETPGLEVNVSCECD